MDPLPRLRRGVLDFLMVQQFPKDLLFLMLRVIHYHLPSPKDRLYRWDRLFRLLPMDPLCRLDLRHRMVPHLHLFRVILMVRLFRRDRLPRLRREVLGRRKDLQFHLDLLRRMDPVIRFHLLFLMLPVIRSVRLLL